jgi:NO-binding membrane sensor protein with MHYT domain
MIKVLSCITVQHSIPLVVLAAAVCAFGSFTSLSLLARARDEKSGAIDWRWLFGPEVYPPTLPVGIYLTFFGVPFLISLLWRRRA